MKLPNRPLRVAITTGDPDGIGTEIAVKALCKLKPIKGVHFYFWRSPSCPQRHLTSLNRSYKRITVSTWPEALNARPASYREIVDINSNLKPAKWVDKVAQASLFGHVDALVTAPLSKTSIIKSGYNLIGHTEILQKITQSKNLFMAFIGNQFNVLLCTGHLPIKSVASKLTADKLEAAIRSANELRQLLGPKYNKKPLALLGLNPHAGEEGIIGTEEIKIFKSALEKTRKARIKIEGPLVPDAAFFPGNWKKYSVFVCPYHDQGLIPFKMIHGQSSGLHLTMGLPFIRTSVDHGTAKNIFGKNKADPNSMVDAIRWAIKLGLASRRGS